MFCEKCGKQLQENSNFCSNCGYSTANDMVNKDIERGKKHMPNKQGGGVLLTILGVIGALFSFPTFISELQHNTYGHGFIKAIEMLFEEYFLIIPTVILSVILIAIGSNKMFNNKN